MEKYFMTSTILDGSSIAEFCFDKELIEESLHEKYQDKNFEEVFKEIKEVDE
jgi:hypothetical protein